MEQVAGALLILAVLLDVFLWVLYARAGTGIISRYLARWTWGAFRAVARPTARWRGAFLSFCGPTILVLLIGVWVAGLTLGTALLIHPALGTAVQSASGTTPTDFVTALFAGGGSLSIMRAGDLEPRTSAFRLLYLFDSLVGISVLSLTLTYLLQVYNALKARNALAFQIHLLSAETEDAAELLAGLGPRGRFDSGYTDLSALGAEIAAVKEAHHFYPVLFYFRFREPFYSVAQVTCIAFDTVSLIRSALDDESCAWLEESGAVTQLWRASATLLSTLESVFLPGGAPNRPRRPSAEEGERWERRYRAAVRRLRDAGIATAADEEEGARRYASLRAEWDIDITALAPAMAYRPEEIDPVGHRPERSDERRPLPTRVQPVA